MSQVDVFRPSLRKLSESLWVLEDTCNVYLVTSGDAGLLIDSGSGAIVEALGEPGIESLEWVLHTHHHRDQCWGTPKLVEDAGVRVAVPEHERHFFAAAHEHWQAKRVFDNYSDGSHFFAPGIDINVDALLEDYETFSWRDFDFFVLPAQGHTFGSSALLATIDERLVAFTGDLMTAGGHVYQLHSLEYDYGDMVGVSFTLQSLQALRRCEPELVLPSHGPPIDDVRPDIDHLEQRLMAIAELGSGIDVSGVISIDGPPGSVLPEPELVQLSEHLLWSGPWACSNFYVLLSESGEVVLVDYGHGLWANLHIGPNRQPNEEMRFIAHHLHQLQDRFGVTSIEAVVVTHAHDDHICGIPYLQRHHETECWALDDVAQVLERPYEWASAPCTLSKAIRVHRALPDGGWGKRRLERIQS